MVKKLLKYEFYAYARTLLPMQAIMLAIGLLCRFVQLFEADNSTYNIVFGSSVAAVVITSIVCLVIVFVFGIVHFYKNLFSTEGYLSFTLPVTPSQHIFSKTVMFLAFTLITLVSVLLCISIATAGEVFVEIMKAAGYLIKEFFTICKGNSVFYIIEFILVVLTALAAECLLFYTCITIGQCARKNRILAAFGVYFIYYFLTQIFGTLFIIIATIVSGTGLLDSVMNFILSHPYDSVHILFALLFVFYAALCALYYFISHRIMKNRLNLE